MADKKISQLTALAAANLAPSTDVLAIVDTSATETKKIVAQDLINGVLNVASAVGIGTASPSTKLTVYDATTPQVTFNNGTSTFIVGNNSGGNNKILYGTGAYPMIFYTNATEALQIDASQNLGLGVTPSAWTSIKAFQVGPLGAISGNSSLPVVVSGNAYATSAGWAAKYITSGYATAYLQYLGEHRWLTAPSWNGTGSDVVSFTQAMTLDASGNLLVGTTSVGGKLTVDSGSSGLYGYFNSTNANGGYFSFLSSGTVHGDIGTAAQVVSGGSTNFGINARGSRALIFGTNETERGRFSAGGVLCINSTSNVGSEITLFKQTAGAGSPVTRIWNDSTSGNSEFIEFATESSYTSRGSITYNRGAGQVAYNITSDARLKENIADAEEAGSKIDAMQVRQFDWKETGNHLDYGFVAQELYDVAPYAVSKPGDDDKMWSVDYSKLVPMLVKEIQSLRSRVAALEAQ